MTATDVHETSRIVNVRIYVEKAAARMKNLTLNMNIPHHTAQK